MKIIIKKNKKFEFVKKKKNQKNYININIEKFKLKF